MAWIETVTDEDARGELAQQFAAARRRAGRVFQIVRLMSPNPAVLERSLALYQGIMFGPSSISRAVRELMAVVVSRVNACRY